MTRSIATALALVAMMAAPAAADTLREALVATYRANPTINAQREALKVTDSGVAIARSGSRPAISGTAGVNQDLTQSGGGRRGQHGDERKGGGNRTSHRGFSQRLKR